MCRQWQVAVSNQILCNCVVVDSSTMHGTILLVCFDHRHSYKNSIHMKRLRTTRFRARLQHGMMDKQRDLKIQSGSRVAAAHVERVSSVQS